jgi:anaerobic ribonucleoside-triphosphate reductase
MKVRKLGGKEEDFSLDKIINAVKKANNSVEKEKRMNDEKINQVVEFVQKKIKNYSTIDVDTIHDFVEKALMNKNQYDIAKAYVLYRNEKKKSKKYSNDELKIISICNSTNEDVSGDNANKRPTFLGTQRDYIAGTKCKTIGRKMLPKEVTKEHDEGSIHFHDMDYSPLQNMSNCCLINDFDMFNNGFAMGNIGIDPSHSFSTACNHLAQIALHVSSSQYGGQSHSWASTLPFLQKSKETISKRIHERCSEFLTEKQMQIFIDEDLKKEINRGVQTFQYQVLCHQSSNGQTPFVSVNLCLAEAMTKQEQKDLAMIIEEVLRQRTEGVKDRKGRIISPLFPKLLYWICDGLNVEETDPYYYLNELACDCVVKRMQPDILSEKKCREAKEGQIIPNMGCRSFLTPYWQKKTYIEKDGKIHKAEIYSILNYGLNWEILDKPNKNYICRSLEPKSIKELWKFILKHTELSNNYFNENGIATFEFNDWKVVYNYLGNTARIQSVSYDKETDEYYIEVLEPKTYGRWNQGVVTINLPYVALKSKLDNRDFYETLDEYLAICRKGLQERHKSIKKIKAENAPILWMDGGLARLNPQDNLDSMLEDDVDYTTISLGYVGLYETCMCLIGKSNTSKDGVKLSKEIMKYMNDKCAEWKNEDKIPYSIYGTPEESTTEKFAKALKKLADGEIIKGVTDHNYVTNSYHVNPHEKIDAFAKLKLEGEYLALSKGGAVSYIECGNNLITNKKVILQLFHYMYENILYSELNFRNEGSCDECDYEGELNIIDDNGKSIFQCPHCLNKNQKTLHYTLRLCGYIGEVANGISSNSPNSNQGRISEFQARVIHIGD